MYREVNIQTTRQWLSSGYLWHGVAGGLLNLYSLNGLSTLRWYFATIRDAMYIEGYYNAIMEFRSMANFTGNISNSGINHLNYSGPSGSSYINATGGNCPCYLF